MDQIHAYKLNWLIKYVISWPTLILMVQTCLIKKKKKSKEQQLWSSNIPT